MANANQRPGGWRRASVAWDAGGALGGNRLAEANGARLPLGCLLSEVFVCDRRLAVLSNSKHKIKRNKKGNFNVVSRD